MINPKNFWFWFGGLGVLAMVMLFVPLALAEPQPELRSDSQKTPMAAPEKAWTVDLNGSGGFIGIGRGGVHITSEGIVYASRFNVMSARHRPCESRLSQEDLQKIAQAVSSAKASTWKSSYDDNGCCDRFHWSLLLFWRALDGAGQTYGTGWYDGNESQLPDDLAELRKVVFAIMKKTLNGCRQ